MTELRALPKLLGASTTLALVLASPAALAAPPWVDRHLTLPAGDWAFDLGLGIAHAPEPPRVPDVSAGMNLEMGVGITDRVELGVRTGIRFGDAGDRALQPDTYGRLFDRQYIDGLDDVLANAELRVRGALLSGPIVDLGLEGRIFVPTEGNQAAIEFGVPMAFHFGGRVRLDVGVFVPTYFDTSPPFGLSVPVDLWIQVTHRLWLGPMTGLYVPLLDNNAPTDVSLGFGLGYQMARMLDFKTMFLFPAVNQDSRFFGAGAGVQIRIE